MRRLEERDAARHVATKARALRKISYLWAMPRITSLSIVEICYCDLGRDGAVGAGRELPAHPRVPALTVPRRLRVPRRALRR